MSQFFDLSDRVRCWVESAIIEAGCPAPDRSFVSAGTVAWDNTCGQLTVGLAGRAFRSIEFPNEYRGQERCFSGYLVVPLAIVWTRCVPASDARGNAPSAEALAAAHEKVYADAAVVWNVVASGALPDDEWERANVTQELVGPLGGVVAVDTRVTIGVGHEVWC